MENRPMRTQGMKEKYGEEGNSAWLTEVAGHG